MTTPLHPHPEVVDPDDRRLISLVHPHGWSQPEPRDPYHLIVIGAGAAGLVSAAGAAGLGARVALVERHLMGGDCLVTGCVPSKALIHAAAKPPNSENERGAEGFPSACGGCARCAPTSRFTTAPSGSGASGWTCTSATRGSCRIAPWPSAAGPFVSAAP